MLVVVLRVGMGWTAWHIGLLQEAGKGVAGGTLQGKGNSDGRR